MKTPFAVWLAFMLSTFAASGAFYYFDRNRDATPESAAVRAWIEQLQNGSAAERELAAAALGQAGSEARMAVPPLIAALRDEDAAVRIQAANALGQLGPEAREAVPALAHALRQSPEPVIQEALTAIRRGESTAVPVAIHESD